MSSIFDKLGMRTRAEAKALVRDREARTGRFGAMKPALFRQRNDGTD